MAAPLGMDGPGDNLRVLTIGHGRSTSGKVVSCRKSMRNDDFMVIWCRTCPKTNGDFMEFHGVFLLVIHGHGVYQWYAVNVNDYITVGHPDITMTCGATHRNHLVHYEQILE